jgi:hypothetical protein
MIAQARVVGQALGIVTSAAVVGLRLPAHLDALAGLPPAEARLQAFVMAAHDAFIVAALICSIGIVASLVRGPGTTGDPPGEAAAGG